MTGRIEGAELCHRIDAAKQLVKYGSKDAAEFIAKYKGVPCGHSINGRPDQADPCSAEERSLVAVTLNAPPTLTRDFLTVLSGIDEFLMARLIRAQTADGVTIIEFLDDVMQDRTDGFKTHHRIAAAKELIVHIVRDEQPDPTPSPSTRETDKRGDSTAVGADPCVRPLPGSHTPSPLTGEGWGEGDSSVVPAKADPRVRPLPGSKTPSPATLERAGVRVTQPSFPRKREPRGAAGAATPQPTPLTPSPTQPSFPRKREPRGAAWLDPARLEHMLSSTHPSSFPRYGAGTQGRGGGRSTPANPAHPEPAEGPRTTKQDGPEHDAPEHNAAGTETPGPPFAERPWGPSA